MTYEDITAMLEEVGLPLAYDHFQEGEAPAPPFLIFLFPRSDNLSADGNVYQKIDELNVELYTDLKQPDVERKVEAVLDEHDIFYNKTEVWIPEEKLYEVVYTTEVLVNADNDG